MKIILLAVGKTATPYISQAVEDYAKRISRYQPFEIVVTPDIKGSKTLSAEEQKAREGRLIIDFLKPGDYAILLDERGRQLTSREFAGEIERRGLQGYKRLVFIIGGPYGFSPEVYSTVTSMLSLSRMTFTHEMVRLFFAEQIYRAMTIMRGEPYHHD
ncbi:MAG: 23S rRNA (pseudouridine(1915)-N(3))-methyltransferase RlmH [Duncaniella sp.]|nr:23S rRNA (pseudouridine(1915)-N(3))-methyltransferase RlmH [Duncaniella sp.]